MDQSLRNNLMQITGRMGYLCAHHVLPQKFLEFFNRKGLDINNPLFGMWVDPKWHARMSYAYNKSWEAFIRANPNATLDKILRHAKFLADKYEFQVFF